MFQDVSAIATRFFKGIGQNCNIIAVQFSTGQMAIFVCGLREFDNGAVAPAEPGGIGDNRSEGIAENAVKQPAARQVNPAKGL